MRVNTRNYILPISFSYKGWQVTISDNSGFLTLADMKVKVKIEIAAWQYAGTLSNAYREELEKNKSKFSLGFNVRLGSKLSEQEEQQIKEAFNYYLKLAEQFAANKRVEYSSSINGGMFDRFMGQNISAIDKAKRQVIDYIDSHLGNVWEEFIQFISKQ